MKNGTRKPDLITTLSVVVFGLEKQKTANSNKQLTIEINLKNPDLKI